MITVKSFTTIIARYESLEDLKQNFKLKPWDNGYQDYTYVSEGVIIPWTEISKLMRQDDLLYPWQKQAIEWARKQKRVKLWME